ncbi:CYTH domain-containing protein [Leucobacter sp. GX0328]
MNERPTESIEIERKYEVPTALALPDAAALAAAGFAAAEPRTFALRAVYYDTEHGDLAQHRLALRRREGGPDAGWHLKHKNRTGAHEFQWPESDEMPAGLRDEVARRIGAEPELTPLAELRTERTVVLLHSAPSTPSAPRTPDVPPRGGAETAVIELVDDRVRTHDLRTGAHRAWREWEAELVPGADTALLDVLEALLCEAGASASPSPAKIARATGRLVPWALAAGADDATLARLRAMEADDLAAGLAADAQNDPAPR